MCVGAVYVSVVWMEETCNYASMQVHIFVHTYTHTHMICIMLTIVPHTVVKGSTTYIAWQPKHIRNVPQNNESEKDEEERGKRKDEERRKRKEERGKWKEKK